MKYCDICGTALNYKNECPKCGYRLKESRHRLHLDDSDAHQKSLFPQFEFHPIEQHPFEKPKHKASVDEQTTVSTKAKHRDQVFEKKNVPGRKVNAKPASIIARVVSIVIILNVVATVIGGVGSAIYEIFRDESFDYSDFFLDDASEALKDRVENVIDEIEYQFEDEDILRKDTYYYDDIGTVNVWINNEEVDLGLYIEYEYDYGDETTYVNQYSFTAQYVNGGIDYDTFYDKEYELFLPVEDNYFEVIEKLYEMASLDPDGVAEITDVDTYTLQLDDEKNVVLFSLVYDYTVEE